MSKKYFIITFGCQMNKSDSERIAAVLEKEGYKKAQSIREADLILVNMCSVRQSAVDRVYGLIPKFKRLKERNPKLKTILTGCILKEDERKFTKRFDQILKIKDLLSYLPKYRTNFSAFVPISTGCNNFCAYCVVPFTCGPLICRNHEEILQETKDLIQRGFKEIWLLGQNVNDYQSPTDVSIGFPKLLKMVDNVPGNFWIRFTSSHPKDFSNELINAMGNCEKVTPYLNLPVQSGDNEVLKRMNRPYTVEQYKNLVKKVREKIPNISLSTDVIVGFPGETKEQFENTIRLFEEIKYDMAYIAKYSPRAQTSAFKLRDNVPFQEKERRWELLTEILRKTALEKSQQYIGKEVKVLIEEVKNNFLIAKTKNYKTTKIKKIKSEDKELIGKFINVKIIEAIPFGLKGIRVG